MTKYKCDICGEKHDKMNVVIECSDCYLKGCKKELGKQRKEILEKIEIFCLKKYGQNAGLSLFQGIKKEISND